MPDFAPDAEGALTGEQTMMLIDAGITGPYVSPTVMCPYPDRSPEAEAWWRQEWTVATTWAVIRGELERADDPLEGVPENLPPFPVHVLPPVMRDLAETIAANKCVPPDLTALLIISAVALVAGPRFIISRGKDWTETLAEWTLTILESGYRKTPAFRVIEGVLHRVERWLEEQQAERNAAQIKDLEDQITKLTAKAQPDSKAEGKDPAAKAKAATSKQNALAEQVKPLAAQIKQLTDEPPMAPRLLAGGNTTPEALELAMAENRGYIGIFDDEGGSFSAVAGPYNNGVPTGLETLLKARDGSWITPNERISRKAKSIPRAVLTYGITCQSHPLMKSFSKLQLREQGFFARWLYSVPRPVVEEIDPPEMDHRAVYRFQEVLERLAVFPVIDPLTMKPQDWPTIELSPEARKLHQELQAEVIERKKDAGDLAFMQDWANKYVGRVLRIAGLLHLAGGCGVHERVSEETMRAALAIGSYALAHASEVYRRAPKMPRSWNVSGVEVEAVGRLKVERWIRASGKTHFTTRDVHRNMRRQTWCRSSDDVEAVLRELAREWVVRVVPRTDGAGRSLAGSPWWVPSPDLVFGRPEQWAA